jgi:deoxyribonucleoside regulator
MKDKDRLALLYRVASMYHEQGLKKFQIANAINQSATQVANLLKEARDAGILRIKVDLPRVQVLERKLKSQFGLHEAVVIPSDRDLSALLKNLGRAAAEYFEQIVPSFKKIALGGGYLMYEMIAHLPDRRRDIDIYPAAIVARGPTVTHIDPLTLVTLLWAKSGHEQGRAHYITVTPPEPNLGLKRTQDYYRQVLRNKRAKELFDSMIKVDAVFASVGGFDTDPAYAAATRYTSKNLLEELNLQDSMLTRSPAIGDIAYSFFDNEGKTKREWNFVPSVGSHLKQISSTPGRLVIIVVGGYKQKSLTAVLRGAICNVLITDADAAEEVLRNI